MTIKDQYLDTLKEIDDWVTISDWVDNICIKYPELLKKANEQGSNHTKPSSGVSNLLARVSSIITMNEGGSNVEVNREVNPREVRWVSDSVIKEHEVKDLEEDLASLTRRDKEKQGLALMSLFDRYRLDEFKDIASALNKYFRTDFEVDHARALMNLEDPGEHHPDNLQILAKKFNGIKNNKNWDRYSWEEQEVHIRDFFNPPLKAKEKLGIDGTQEILDALIARLKTIY